MGERSIFYSAKEEGFHLLELSAYEYQTPIRPRVGEEVRFWKDSPTHTGNFKNALDIITPDPRKNPLPVFAPQSGRVISLVQENDQFGDSVDFLYQLNYVTVQVGKKEFYELCHIAKDSCPYQIGQEIKQGDQIAVTGANGWMTDVRHLHFLVGQWLTPNTQVGQFRSLKIRFKKETF